MLKMYSLFFVVLIVCYTEFLCMFVKFSVREDLLG